MRIQRREGESFFRAKWKHRNSFRNWQTRRTISSRSMEPSMWLSTQFRFCHKWCWCRTRSARKARQSKRPKGRMFLCVCLRNIPKYRLWPACLWISVRKQWQARRQIRRGRVSRCTRCQRWRVSKWWARSIRRRRLRRSRGRWRGSHWLVLQRPCRRRAWPKRRQVRQSYRIQCCMRSSVWSRWRWVWSSSMDHWPGCRSNRRFLIRLQSRSFWWWSNIALWRPQSGRRKAQMSRQIQQRRCSPK